jgi:hypothetical protein
VNLEEKAGIQRKAEPVEVLLSFQASQTASLAREIRVAEIKDGILTEVISQVFSEIRRGAEKICKLLFLADNQGKEKRTYLIFYGNPDAELPNYQSDLKVTGEGYGLDIENEYFTAYLSKQTGQLARMVLKREHGLEIYSGGQGHGEPAGIDWAHDYVTEDNFSKSCGYPYGMNALILKLSEAQSVRSFVAGVSLILRYIQFCTCKDEHGY